MTALKTYLILAIFSFLFYACGNEKKELSIDQEFINDPIPKEVALKLPSPLEISTLFKSAGMSYVGDLTSQKENINKFNSTYDQKINFGIYSADMTYCIMNDQTQESINYLNTLRKLSEKLWMTDVFNTLGLRDRLEKNAGETDSLKSIMSDLQLQLDAYLDENGMGYTGSIIFAGAWIETMYLGLKANELEKNEKLISRLSEQAKTLNDLIKAIQHVDEDNDYIDLITDLENINLHFDVLRDQIESDKLVFSDSQLQKLSLAIEQLRTKIIEA